MFSLQNEIEANAGVNIAPVLSSEAMLLLQFYTQDNIPNAPPV